MKKTTDVKAHTKHTKSGKIVNVKASKREYDAAEDIAKDAIRKAKGAGSEFEKRKTKPTDYDQYGFTKEEFEAWYENTDPKTFRKVEKALKEVMGADGWKAFKKSDAYNEYTKGGADKFFKKSLKTMEAFTGKKDVKVDKNFLRKLPTLAPDESNLKEVTSALKSYGYRSIDKSGVFVNDKGDRIGFDPRAKEWTKIENKAYIPKPKSDSKVTDSGKSKSVDFSKDWNRYATKESLQKLSFDDRRALNQAVTEAYKGKTFKLDNSDSHVYYKVAGFGITNEGTSAPESRKQFGVYMKPYTTGVSDPGGYRYIPLKDLDKYDESKIKPSASKPQSDAEFLNGMYKKYYRRRF